MKKTRVNSNHWAQKTRVNSNHWAQKTRHMSMYIRVLVKDW
jgi:hypothetical protein